MTRCGVCGEHKYMELYRCVVCDVCKTYYKSYICDDCYKSGSYSKNFNQVFIPNDFYFQCAKSHREFALGLPCKSCRREEKLNKIGI